MAVSTFQRVTVFSDFVQDSASKLLKGIVSNVTFLVCMLVFGFCLKRS